MSAPSPRLEAVAVERFAARSRAQAAHLDASPSARGPAPSSQFFLKSSSRRIWAYARSTIRSNAASASTPTAPLTWLAGGGASTTPEWRAASSYSLAGRPSVAAAEGEPLFARAAVLAALPEQQRAVEARRHLGRRRLDRPPQLRLRVDVPLVADGEHRQVVVQPRRPCAGAPPAAAVAAAAVASERRRARHIVVAERRVGARTPRARRPLSGAARDEQRVELRRVVDAVLIRKHREGQLLEQRGDGAARRIGGAEGGECGARVRHRVEQALSAASAAPRASPPARSAARASTYSAPSGLRAAEASPSRPPAAAAAAAPPPSSSRQHARSGVGALGGRRREVLAQELRDVVRGERLARALVQHREVVQAERAATAVGVAAEGERVLEGRVRGLGLRIRRARDAEARVQRGARRPPLARARERRRRRLGAGRRRSRGGRRRTRAHQRRHRLRRRRRLAHLLRHLADRRGVGVGVGDAGEVARAASSADRRAPSSRSLARPAAAPSPSPPSKAASAAHAACSRANDSTSAAPASASARRGGGGCGGGGGGHRLGVGAEERRDGERLGAPAHRRQRARLRLRGGGRVADEGGERPAAQRELLEVCVVLECRHSLEQRAHRAHARAGSRRRVVAAARALGVAFGRRERGGDAAHRGHEGALRLVRAEQPQGDRAGAERDAQLRRRPRARAVAGGGGGGASRSRSQSSDARAWRSRRQPAASSGAVARCSSYRSRPHTSALCNAHVSCHARLGAPGSDRSWRSAPRACLACSSASAHRPRADAAQRASGVRAQRVRQPEAALRRRRRQPELGDEVGGVRQRDVRRRAPRGEDGAVAEDSSPRGAPPRPRAAPRRADRLTGERDDGERVARRRHFAARGWRASRCARRLPARAHLPGACG